MRVRNSIKRSGNQFPTRSNASLDAEDRLEERKAWVKCDKDELIDPKDDSKRVRESFMRAKNRV
jgi:hypothetical protein